MPEGKDKGKTVYKALGLAGYTAGGKRYALDVNYELLLCGTVITDPECEPG